MNNDINNSGLFDLNIEQVLEHWNTVHAVREIIANALDEQILTKSRDVEIFKSNDSWHIRDYGRGLKYEHFTQNENKEKIESPNLIGKFGVGLKDALAVFYRKGIRLEINSKFACISLVMAHKSGFDLLTLHAKFQPPRDNTMEGTDFVIFNVEDKIIEDAKNMFLCFDERIKHLETTPYGEVLQKDGTPLIYINGVQVATESNFLFSYNITNLNAKIKKALNRERSNVSRMAYSDSVKNILCKCQSRAVLNLLADDLKKIALGTNKDEVNWTDVATHATIEMGRRENVVVVTPTQLGNMKAMDSEILHNSEKTLVIIPESVITKVDKSVNTFDTIVNEYKESFKYSFVENSQLTNVEQSTYCKKDIVIDFLKRHDLRYDIPIKISETICPDERGVTTNGVFTGREIIIKRSILSSYYKFISVLAHEFTHAQHCYDDNTRDFENDLTMMLGCALMDMI